MKPADAGRLAELALRTIHDGVVIVNREGVINYINPAAVDMTGCGRAENAVNLDFSLIMKFETTDGTKVDDANNLLLKAIRNNEAFETRDYVMIAGQNEKKTPVALVMTPSGNAQSNRIITFRNITKELEEEGAQTEFISTASHEMRTPVASIEGYLGLALNPATATIDSRAKQYLESAHSASQHLGRLFKDLLDVTKLDDKRIKTKLVPLELTGFVKKFMDEYLPKFTEKHLKYSFGADTTRSGRVNGGRTIEQVVYTYVDVDFLGEILSNLIENAIKYTPEGGAIWVNVLGDGDRALINVTDTGIGIAAEDLQHIFQKFYRADNSQTRTVGGTGLGLYLVKQRTEAMDGRVWAESAFGEGSTFYVSLPRLSGDEYEKRQIALQNQKAVQAFAEKALNENVAGNAAQIQMRQAQASATTPSFGPTVLSTAATTAAPAAAPVSGVAPAMQPVQPAQAQPIQPVQPVVQQVPVQPAPQLAVQQSVTQQPVQPVVQQVPVQPVPQPVVQQPVQQPVQVVAPQAPIQQPVQQPVQPVTPQPVQNNQNVRQ